MLFDYLWTIMKFLKDYFNFNKSERQTILVLLVLLFLVYSTLFFLRSLPPEPGKDYSYLDDRMDSLINSSKADQKSKYQFEKFDPNKVSFQKLVDMGVRKKDAQTMLKYRKFKPFKRPSDLRKLYFMSEDMFAQMEPFIVLKPNEYIGQKGKRATLKNNIVSKSGPKTKPDINTADTTELKQVYGIGSYLAKQIVWYRNRLGGFINIDQLREVKGLRAESFQDLKGKVKLTKIKIRRINLNEANWKEIVSHPYITSEKASRIVKYRNEFGNITTFEELIVVGIFTKKEGHKLSPYVRFY